MTHKKLLYVSLVLSLVLVWIITNRYNVKHQSTPTIPTHPLIFFDENTFNAGVFQAEKKDETTSYHISGGIIPHHLFPGFIIADFFHRLSGQKPTTIILMGPNHYERGNYKVLSSLYGWETPFGVVEPDQLVIETLLKNNVVKIDEDVLPHDHAVAGIMPFIKYYLPDAKVVPILVSGFMKKNEVSMLSSTLQQYMNKEIVMIAAVDFSHYLTNQQAYEKDKVTLHAMRNFDYRRLFSFNNDYVDSPPSIATLLMVMQQLGITTMDVLYHTNSGELQKNNYIETTSYFSIAFH